MAPVTPVIMRVLRPRCYRHRLAVHGIATNMLIYLYHHKSWLQA